MKFYWNRSVAGRVSADFVEGRILALDELIALCYLTVQEYGPVPRHRTEVAGIRRRAVMPPAKYWDQMKVGEQVQHNYAFISKLFDDVGQKAFRDRLFAYATEDELRAALIAEGIPLLDGVRLMMVDIENARTKTFGPIDAANENFYLLTLPPVPRRTTTDPTKADYKRNQAWEGAWHHAIVDGYGM